MTDPRPDAAKSQAINFEGAFVLPHFRMVGSEDHKIWFKGADDKPEEFGVHKVRDFLKASLNNPIDGLEGEELLMAWILKNAKGEKGKNKELAARIHPIVESDSRLKTKIEEMMKKPEVLGAIEEIEKEAGINES